MKLSYIFELLSQGELSQVAIGGNDSCHGIQEKNYRTMGNNVFLALTALYKRFNLKFGTVTVQLQEGMYTYPLLQKYAVNDKTSKEPVRFILDSPEDKFKGDILKVWGVQTAHGNGLVMNDYMNGLAIETPSLNVIRVPMTIVDGLHDLPDYYKTDRLRITYVANHAQFVPKEGYFDPLMTEIELPDSHLQALLYYIASRVSNPIGMGAEFNAGNNWAARYEAECQMLEARGNMVDRSGQIDVIRRGGWA